MKRLCNNAYPLNLFSTTMYGNISTKDLRKKKKEVPCNGIAKMSDFLSWELTGKNLRRGPPWSAV